MNRRNVLVNCPFHNDKTPSLSIDTESGLFYCHGCGAAGGSVYSLFRRMNQPMPENLTGRTQRRPLRSIDRTAKLEAEWNQTHLISIDDAAGKYLAGRSIIPKTPPLNLRFHPHLDYWILDEAGDWQSVGKYPAMIGRIEGLHGKLAGLHRTYLTDDGCKADLPEQRKMIAVSSGSTRGSAVRLSSASNRLAVAEGIETALAYEQLTNLPAWAALTAGGMEQIELPKAVTDVWICVDLDRSGRGELAAGRLAQRLIREGKRVFKATPPGAIPEGAKGLDWCDALGFLRQNEYTTNSTRPQTR
jgi:putative DNA primase/helicase